MNSNHPSSSSSDKRSRGINNGFPDTLCILHVDDDEDFLKLTKNYIEEITEKKMEVDSLINPKKALRILQEKSYDVIVADYRMPSMDGLQLLEQLREKNITIPFIIFTGRGREEVAIEALNIGADRYIKKGMDTESQFLELIHAIQEVVNHKQTSERLYKAQQLARICFIDWNLKTDRFYLSDTTINACGLDPGKKWTKEELIPQIVHPDDMDYVQENLEMASQGTKNYNIYHRILHADGTVLWVHALAEMTHDGEGKPRSLLVTLVDITERKQIEEALKYSEKRFRRLAEASFEGIVVHYEGRILDVNQAFLDMFGYDMSELSSLDGFSLITPENRERVLSEVISGTEGSYEIQAIRKDGTTFPIEGNAKHMLFENKMIRVASVRDITKRKKTEKALRESEERLRSFMDSATDTFCLLDSELNIVDINKVEIEMTPLSIKKEDIIGKNLREFLPEHRRPSSFNSYREVLKKGKPIFIDYIIPHSLFGEMYLSIKVFKVGDGLGMIISDVTKYKHVEGTLRAVNQELQDFASIMAHDLKAPLRNIKNLVDRLVRDSGDDLNEQGKDHLDSLIKQTTHMDTLIEGIHHYSKIDRVDKKVDSVNLNELLAQIIKIISPPDNIEIAIQNELPVLSVDRAHMSQILTNLLDNAVKFMDKPQGYIIIGHEEKVGFWQFSVADNGPGIEERHHKRIFQMFQTLSTIEEAKGTGIGLAVVKKVVEMNGGKIWLESTMGEGTTFYFTLSKVLGGISERIS